MPPDAFRPHPNVQSGRQSHPPPNAHQTSDHVTETLNVKDMEKNCLAGVSENAEGARRVSGGQCI